MRKFIDIDALTIFYNKLTTMFAKISHKHNVSDINEDETHKFVSDEEKALWNSKANSSGTYDGMTVGNAKKLTTPVKINNVDFDGSKSINIYDNTKLPLTGGTISGSLKVDSLVVEGEITGWNSVQQYSDISLKRNIKKIDNSLDKINAINGYTFDMITDDKKHAGVIAQEIQKVLPEVVYEDEYGLLSVSYGNIVSLLIEGIKELNNQVRELQEEIKELKNREE